ncbi:MAG: DUF4114 domain-containing protein [Bacteroidales bacterium]
MKISLKVHKLLIICFFMVLLSCNKDIDTPDDHQDENQLENITVNNNVESFHQRITNRNELVPVDRDLRDFLKEGSADEVDYTKNFAFTIKADVDPPSNLGTTLMATHVDIHDDYAFVSYNVQGAEYGGAIEVFDVSDIDDPQIISQAIFPTADINSVVYDNQKLYFSGALEEFEMMDYDGPAFLGTLNLNAQMQITLFGIIIVDVKSYSSNSVTFNSDKIFITSGDQGSLTVFDKNLNVLSSSDVFDARSVFVNSDHAFVLAGQPGTIHAFDLTTLAETATFDIGGANTPHSKSEVYATDEYIFAALNEGGMSMLHTDGNIKQNIPKPETPDGGDDEKYVTNSVSVNNTLVLMGNGEAGIAAGEMIAEDNDNITILGDMVFDDMNSANFVTSKDDIVFVASGLGGLKILSIGVDDGLPDDYTATEVCPGFYNSIIDLLPAQQNLMENNPSLFANDISHKIITSEETEVYVTFMWEVASWKNTLGYYAYPADNPPITAEDIEKHVVFPNISMVDSGGALEPGYQVQLGTTTFPPNTVIGFYLVAQGWANGQTTDGIYTIYSDDNLNPNENRQSITFIGTSCNELTVAFEDIKLPGGDKDYNDVIFFVKDNPDQMSNSKFDVQGIYNFTEQ